MSLVIHREHGQSQEVKGEEELPVCMLTSTLLTDTIYIESVNMRGFGESQCDHGLDHHGLDKDDSLELSPAIYSLDRDADIDSTDRCDLFGMLKPFAASVMVNSRLCFYPLKSHFPRLHHRDTLLLLLYPSSAQAFILLFTGRISPRSLVHSITHLRNLDNGLVL